MNITELIEKHRNSNRHMVVGRVNATKEFAIELLEMVKRRGGLHSNPTLRAVAIEDDLNKALEELRK